MQDLNTPQQQAITCIDSPCLVLAGAGSGKTRVITYKVAHLIHTAGYAPSTIRAVTFTNKSAREMKQRITALLGKKYTKGLGISTFHTLGLRILQSEYLALGYRKGFSIMDARDVESCLGELTHRSEQDDPAFVKQTMYQISGWKNEFISTSEALTNADTPLARTQATIYQAYQQHLLACNAMDFDDLIMLPVQLLRSDDNILLKWRGKIHYLLVDEYQDTNTSQYELIKLICGLRQKLTVVGDDDQSIYAWRGARPENINRLRDDFRDIQVIKLEQNYRSSGRILNAANKLIANNPHLFNKKLWSAAGAGEFIRVFPCNNTKDEANRVAIDIISKRFQSNDTYSNFAVLYRSNFQSRNYEKALRENSIPYQITGGTAFFERREVKDIMSYLRLLVNIDDDQALIRIINTPRREIGSRTIQQIASYASNRRCSMGQALQELGLKESIGNRAWQRLQSFIDLVSELRSEVEQLDAMAVARLLIARLDYSDWLVETCSSQKQAESAMENIQELISWIGNLQKTHDDGSLSALISHLSLMSMLENNEDKNEQDAVQLMTLHAAKGLEYPHVYLVCFEEDSLPHHQSQDADGLEEERRLAYVGITRAEKTLTICHAKTRHKFGELQHCEPSRFLFELPEEDLDGAEHTTSKLSEYEKHQRGLDTFADLKSLLGTAD
ncbi:MAG: UvrD-helicase domain-containing protein [Gammaproteobacteria bacterium]|nr:UvrD-helicase domain-containing protein [Gammaproteobacteria bacterium]